LLNDGLSGKRGTILGIFESIYDITEAAAAILSTVIATKIGFEAYSSFVQDVKLQQVYLY
jgi:hypothetical protein